jgi:hypothetical protein
VVAETEQMTARARRGRKRWPLTLAVPPGSITVGFLAKEPGAQMRLGTAEMTFR